MIKVIKNILPPKVNKEILTLLKSTSGWYFGNDKSDKDFLLHEDEGLALRTFGGNKVDHQNFLPLNLFAHIVSSIVCEKLNFNLKEIHRVNYNFYHGASKGNLHIDSDKDSFYSILYNLNTNDGYTKINGKKFFSNESEAIFFKSNIPHFGNRPSKGLRYNLNIIIS